MIMYVAVRMVLDEAFTPELRKKAMKNMKDVELDLMQDARGKVYAIMYAPLQRWEEIPQLTRELYDRLEENLLINKFESFAMERMVACSE